MPTTDRQAQVIPILRELADRGWTNLKSLGIILGYAHDQSIYARQRSKNPIETIRIGHINRVYEEAALEAIAQLAPGEAEYILNLYRSIKNHVESVRIT